MADSTLKNLLNRLLPLALIFVASFVAGAEWQVVGELAHPVTGAQAVAYDSKIYIFGGESDETGGAVDIIQEFDPYDFSCRVLNIKMLEPRSHFVADKSGDSLVLATGVTFAFDEAGLIEGWKPYGLPTSLATHDYFRRINATGGVFGDKLYIVGGYAPIEFGFLSLPYIVEYDLRQRETTYSHPLVDAILPYQHLSAFLDSNLVIFGGVYNGVSNKILRFNLVTHELDTLALELSQPRAAGGVAVDYDGAAYLIGGYNETQRAIWI